MSKYLDKLNNKLKLLKLLHEPKTREECVRAFDDENGNPGIDERTIRNYINEGDIQISNVVIPFCVNDVKNSREQVSDGRYHFEEHGTNAECYRSSVHPIILPLNLSEVYLLTNGLLDLLGSSHPQYDAYKEIASKIYSQLSPYAKRKIPQALHGLKNDEIVQYTSESEMIEKNHFYVIGMAMKMRKDVVITCVDGKTISGQLVYDRHEYYLENEEGRTRINDLGIKNIKMK